MATTAKAKKKRAQLGIIISREMKKRIEALARKSGQSQGQIAEQLMLKQFAYEDLVAATRKGIEEIHKGNVEAELHRLGFTRRRTTPDAAGKQFSAWYEPGHPKATRERSGFIQPDDGDRRSIELREYEDGTTEVIHKDGSEEKEPKTHEG